MKKVIITGGAGFLGAKLSETLNNSGYEASNRKKKIPI